jgi:hypothetical protein
LTIVDEKGTLSWINEVTINLTGILIDVLYNFKNLLQVGRAFVEGEVLTVQTLKNEGKYKRLRNYYDFII